MSEISDDFSKQLGVFKTSIVDMYRQKTKSVAKRDALRFRYLTGQKAKIQNTIYSNLSSITSAGFAGSPSPTNDIFAQSGGYSDPLADTVLRGALGIIQQNIPMVTVSGADISGWGPNPSMVGGPMNVGFLSATEDIISKPFFGVGAEDPSPAYKLYPGVFSGVPSSGEVLDQAFLGQGMNLPDEAGQWESFSFPPSHIWLKALGRMYGAGPGNVESAYDYIVGVIMKVTPNGTLEQVAGETKAMLKDLIEQTQTIVALQMNLDTQEHNLSDFVTAYKDYLGTNATVEDMMAQFKAEADAAPMPVEVSDSAGKKPNWMLIGASVAGAFLLMKDK